MSVLEPEVDIIKTYSMQRPDFNVSLLKVLTDTLGNTDMTESI